MRQVAILVVTFNRLALMKECITSLRLQTFKDIEIIVVNNGSTDGTKEWLEMQNDIITITQNNLGGAGGFFTGMKYITESDYKYCWLMDDDVVCTATALEELMNVMQLNSDIGFVCSKVVGVDGLPMNVPVIDGRPAHNGYPNWFNKIEYQLIKVRTATFVSILLPTVHIRKLGLPIKEFFIWGDDTEYTKRISTKYDSYLVCKSVVIHKRMQQNNLSFFNEKDKNRLKMYFYYFRNNSFVYNQDASFLGKMKQNCYFLIIFLKMVFTLDFIRAYIILKSRIALLTFHPMIQYPAANLKP
jgi:GT2 family glycosyltransferase